MSRRGGPNVTSSRTNQTRYRLSFCLFPTDAWITANPEESFEYLGLFKTGNAG